MLFDQPESWRVRNHQVIHTGHIVALARDEVVSPARETLSRELCQHPGSVAILAIDDHDRVAVVRQYRHPVRMRLVEPPAGLLDIPGEAPWDAAKRELAEEAQLAGANWAVLADYYCSPGITNEVARIFLATGLSPAPRPNDFAAHGEEVDMGLAWVPVDELLAGVNAGLVGNAALVVGITALCLARAQNRLDQLRPPDAAWPAHERAVKQSSGQLQ